ncbi:MAG: hypothetical protein GQ531_05195 [Sulfurovum sp.]|nr:hypothetical protein [Sulfurovum sp.]
MFKILLTLICTTFLLLPNLVMAEDEQNASSEIAPAKALETEVEPQEEVKEEISEAQKEANAAEEAELREAEGQSEVITQ